MKVAVNLLLVAGCFASVQAFAQIDEPDIDADCVKAGIYAAAGKVAYQQGDMGKAREIFRNQVRFSRLVAVALTLPQNLRSSKIAFWSWCHHSMLIKMRVDHKFILWHNDFPFPESLC